MSRPDYYELLGLSRDASDDQIKKAYRAMAMKHHPDRNPGDASAEESFKMCSEAYQVLSDPEKRSIYDRFGHEGLSGRGFQGFSGMDDVFSHFQDIFQDFFGGMGGPSQRNSRRGADLQTTVTISMKEAYLGIKKDLDLKHPTPCAHCAGTGAENGQLDICKTCGGQGQVARGGGLFMVAMTCPACQGRGKSIRVKCKPCHGKGETVIERIVKVNIPAGIDDGQTLRLNGQGQASAMSGETGNLYVSVRVTPDARFERDGPHLIHRLEVSISEAALGTKKHLTHLDDSSVEIDIPAGTQPGEILRIAHQGMPDLNHRKHKKGDLACVVMVKVPKKLSSKAKHLLKELSEEL